MRQLRPGAHRASYGPLRAVLLWFRRHYRRKLVMPRGQYKRVTRPLAERLWEKVQKGDQGECWIFHGSKNEHGYGQIWDGENKRLIKAHKAAYEVTYGRTNAYAFLHMCDNPSCCNPSHIRPGTLKQNSQDMVNKGRHKTPFGYGVRGERHPSSKLTNAQRAAIRNDLRSHRKIAAAYSISKTQVTRIKSDTAGGNW